MKEEYSKGDIIEHRMNKARESLIEAKAVAKIGFINSSVNRLYYSCFYAVSALLLQENIPAKTHAGVRQMLGLHFVEPEKVSKRLGKLYSDLFESRQDSDYEDFFTVEIELLADLTKGADDFIAAIEKLININLAK
jgi:uncharacterized protein (UPF0332 family)